MRREEELRVRPDRGREKRLGRGVSNEGEREERGRRIEGETGQGAREGAG